MVDVAVRLRRAYGARLCVLAALVAGLAAAACRSRWPAAAGLASSQLCVANSDFSDLAGLTDSRADGWFHGVPRGWTSTATDTRYSVNRLGGPTAPTCNVSQLGLLQQMVGALPADSDVVLTMDVSEAWQPDAGLGSAILGRAGGVLATSSYQAGTSQTLVAANVPAGTPITVQFWALWGTTPGLDNVSVTAFPPGSQTVGAVQASLASK